MNMKSPFNGQTTRYQDLACMERGFTLLEILVAMIVIAIGVLGIAGLQASALRYSKNSEGRAIAVQLTTDLVERMRANTAGLRNGEYASLASFATTTCVKPAPVVTTATASTDVAHWRNALACDLPLGTGRMVQAALVGSGLSEVEITLQWDESRLQGGSAKQTLVTRVIL
jgi:type IV pilus assembly protein PilV